MASTVPSLGQEVAATAEARITGDSAASSTSLGSLQDWARPHAGYAPAFAAPPQRQMPSQAAAMRYHQSGADSSTESTPLLQQTRPQGRTTAAGSTPPHLWAADGAGGPSPGAWSAVSSALTTPAPGMAYQLGSTDGDSPSYEEARRRPEYIVETPGASRRASYDPGMLGNARRAWGADVGDERQREVSGGEGGGFNQFPPLWHRLLPQPSGQLLGEEAQPPTSISLLDRVPAWEAAQRADDVAIASSAAAPSSPQRQHWDMAPPRLTSTLSDMPSPRKDGAGWSFTAGPSAGPPHLDAALSRPPPPTQLGEMPPRAGQGTGYVQLALELPAAGGQQGVHLSASISQGWSGMTMAAQGGPIAATRQATAQLLAHLQTVNQGTRASIAWGRH